MSNMLRITGMATGMDTDTMVKQMLKPYSMKIDKVKQSKQILQWKQDIYRDIITDIRALKTSFLDNVNPESNLLLKSNYAGFDVSSSSVATATATATVGAVAGNYTVNVTSLAQGAKLTGNALAGKTTSTKLSDLAPSIAGDISLQINVNGTDKTITLADAGNKTIDELVNAINTQTNGEVTARFSDLTKTFSLETNKTGINSSVKIVSAGTTADIITALGINAGDIDVAKQGANANLTIVSPGGDPLAPIPVTTQESNDFTIDGVNYSLKGAGSTTLSVSTNTDKIYDKVMGFITKYNELVDKVSQKVEQKRQYSYTPLTDDQKKDMKEDEIKSWEERAKEGLIKGDTSLTSMLTSMRNAFFEGITGVGISLKDLGLNTSSDYTKRGKIVIDESLTADAAKKKFTDALKSNGTQVADLFCKTGATYSEKGIFQRLNDTIENYTRPYGAEKGILLQKAGMKGSSTDFKNFLSEQIIQKDKYISDLNAKLSAKENSFYSMFAKLESAMNKANSQSGWLSQQLGGGQ